LAGYPANRQFMALVCLEELSDWLTAFKQRTESAPFRQSVHDLIDSLPSGARFALTWELIEEQLKSKRNARNWACRDSVQPWLSTYSGPVSCCA